MAKIMTKAEESAIVDQIEALINQTEANSYTRMAFAGCVNMARENIEYDFANSYPEMIEYKDKQNADAMHKNVELKNRIAELEQKVKDAREYRDSTESVIDNMDKELTDAKKNAKEWEQQAYSIAEELEDANEELMRMEIEINHLKAEIVRLKLERMTEDSVSKIYDLMKEREQNA